MKTKELFRLLLFFLVTSFSYGQGNEPYLKRVMAPDNQVLSAEKLNKLNKLRTAKYHKELNLVKLGDFKKSLQNESLVIDIPGRQGSRIQAKTRYFDFSSENQIADDNTPGDAHGHNW